MDLNNIRRIIHIGVPYTMEEYFQKVGRAGRDGQPASAIMHFKSFDISKARKGMSDVMREYAVTANRCRLEMIVNYFGYKSAHNFDPIHIYCDFYKNLCQCGSCSVETVSDLNSSFNDITIAESPGM